MHRHIADPLLVFELQPRRGRDFLADLGDEFLVHLGAPLQTVQGMLELINELVGLSGHRRSKTRSLQIGNRTNLISLGLICHQR